MKKGINWEDVIWGLVVIVVIVAMLSAILIGQNLRNKRAASVIAGEYVTTIRVPEGFTCAGEFIQPNLYTVVCKPWH